MTELYATTICQQLLGMTLIYDKPLQVHSVFDSVVNMIGEDIFFSIISDKHCLLPMSCKVVSLTPFPSYRLEAGMSVKLSGTDIYIPQASLAIRLHNHHERDLSICSVEGWSIPNDMMNKIDLLKILVYENGGENDLSTLVTGKYSNPYAKAIERRLPEYVHAVKNNNVRAAELAGRIAGGGIGLTPSSDDLLVGYICVFLAHAKALNNAFFEKALLLSETMGREASEHTNTISGAFIKQCGRGLFSEDMMKLLKAVYSNSGEEPVELYGRRILEYGSTSGVDMLTGMVIAMTSLNEE